MITGDIETSEKVEYEDFLESGAYVKKLEETYNRYLDVRDKKLVDFMKENKRLHSIIKEVREFALLRKEMYERQENVGGQEVIISLLEILDKESK